MMNEKAEQFTGESLFYVLTANIGELNKLPDYYIVPSDAVAEYVTRNHLEWKEKAGKKGQPHNDTSIRQFRDERQEFKDRWELIEAALKDT